MEIDEAIRAIEKRVAANYSDAPLSFDNEPPIERRDPFVRVSVQTGDTFVNLDSTFERSGGLVFLSAFVPKGRGDLLAWQMARQVARTLTYKTFDSVRCRHATFQNLGLLNDASVQDSGWFQVNAVVPFWFENYP
jgi:hypothetical protein